MEAASGPFPHRCAMEMLLLVPVKALALPDKPLISTDLAWKSRMANLDILKNMQNAIKKSDGGGFRAVPPQIIYCNAVTGTREGTDTARQAFDIY